MRHLFSISLAAALLTGCGEPPAPPMDPRIQPVVETASLGEDADDPAIWVNPADPAASLILGVNKAPAPAGAVGVFDLDGQLVQLIDGIDRPNNIDLEYGFPLGGETVDIAVATERYQSRLRVFAVDPQARRLRDVSSPDGLQVFAGETGERAAPMGVSLYRRPSDNAFFAIVSRKEGPTDGYLWQYRLEDDGAGRVRAVKVREFGAFSGTGEIEAVAVDDEFGHVYYADELAGVHKYHANPDHPAGAAQLQFFAQDGFQGDREGLAVYASAGGGYVLCTDQITGGSAYQVYSRSAESPAVLVGTVKGGADETDGIEATSAPLGPRFPNGLLVVMNSVGKNFMLYDWRDVATALAAAK